MVVVGMAVIGIAILYAIFYVWLGVDSPGSLKVTECMSLTAFDLFKTFIEKDITSNLGVHAFVIDVWEER